ncbi:MAG: phosphoglucosamine mutase [Sphingomonadales bacterium]|nr:phosphoglucosamine mutase [Sphingomonadales bacterium]
MTLIASVSGIRGTIGGHPGTNLTPSDIVSFVNAYAALLIEQGHGRKVVVGRDARISGDMLNRLVCGTLMACGMDVLDLGLTTTPTLEMQVPRVGAAGGIVLTASHNPEEWNALKLLDHQGCFIGSDQGETLLKKVQSGKFFSFATVHQLGKYEQVESALEAHIQDILALPLVNRQAIAAAGLHVVVDGINSTGALAVPTLLAHLGVSHVHVLNDQPHGHFAHNPEPLREHLDEICSEVVARKAHLGIVVDPDVDRLAFVMEDGELFGEEYTLVAVADYVMRHQPGPAVSNLSSSRALRDVCNRYQQPYHASPVGEVHVVKAMREFGAVIGGEGNGGIIVPELHYGRDALVGIALFLTHYVVQGLSMSQLKAIYPSYFMVKEKVTFDPSANPELLLQRLAEAFPNATHHWSDGLKIDLDEGWLHVRKSNTEPILRIYSEAGHANAATELAAKARQILAS